MAKERITIDPEVLAGKPIIRGTRVAVEHVLDMLAAGASVGEVAREYKLKQEDVLAALEYAAKALRHEEVLLPG